MDKKELHSVIEEHGRWLKSSEGARANLRGAILNGANLSYANLSYANLRGANLSYANLNGADLSYANLSYANLNGAILDGAILNGAILSDANLSYANLRGAILNGADLTYANLSYANLRGAKGFIFLPVQDYRGYSFAHATLQKDGIWRIRAGCRLLTIVEAKEHWGKNYKGERDIGDMYLYAVDWLENKLQVEEPTQ